MSTNNIILLPPPQHVELSLLSHCYDIAAIPNLAKEKNKKGLTFCSPKVFNLKDGIVFTLPGTTRATFKMLCCFTKIRLMFFYQVMTVMVYLQTIMIQNYNLLKQEMNFVN